MLLIVFDDAQCSLNLPLILILLDEAMDIGSRRKLHARSTPYLFLLESPSAILPVA